MILLNAPDFFSFCSGQRDDPLAVPYVSGFGSDRRVIAPPKIDGRSALMRSKALLRFGIGLGLWILAATCFVLEGLAIREAQLCSGIFGSANPKWAFPWTMYGLVQGLMLIVAGSSVWVLWLGLQRLEWRDQKGKAKEESTSLVEIEKVTVKKDKGEGMWEMQDLDPEEPTRDSGTDGRRDEGRSMKGIAGEGSSKMAETRPISRGLSMVSSATESLARRWPSVGEPDQTICMGHEHGKIQAYDRPMRTNSRLRPKLQVLRGSRWEDEEDVVEPIPLLKE
ncbi:hypothetical protein MMC29_001774 [Sticta canariensis]|nr:hypothetical protein [Sticta canariensis]